VGWVYQDHLAASVCRFVGQVLSQVSPAGVQNALREAVIAGHSVDLQLFQGNKIVPADQVVSEFIEKVPSAVGDVLVLALQGQDSLPAAAAAHLPPRDSALQGAESRLRLAVPARIFHYFIIAGCNQVMNANVHANRSSGWRKGLFIHFASKTGIPFPRLPADAQGLDPAFDGPVPADAQSAHPVNSQPAAIQLETIPVFLQAKTIEAVAALEARITWLLSALCPAEEGGKGFVQVGNNGLENVAVDIGGVRISTLQVLHPAKLF
jgi:hypothetical protein